MFSREGWAAIDALTEGKALNIEVMDRLVEGGFKSSYRTREPREDDDGSAAAAARRELKTQRARASHRTGIDQ